MKSIVWLLALCSLCNTASYACDDCQKQQSAFVRAVGHGKGPDSRWDFVIVGMAALVVMVTLYYSIKWLVSPGERSASHIKNQVTTTF